MQQSNIFKVSPYMYNSVFSILQQIIRTIIFPFFPLQHIAVRLIFIEIKKTSIPTEFIGECEKLSSEQTVVINVIEIL